MRARGHPRTGPDGISRRAILFGLSAQVFLIMLGLGLVAPILPLYAQSFGVGAAAVGTLVTIFGVARMAINIPAGHWTERFGRRALLIIGPLMSAVGSFGFAVATSFAQLLGWRVLQGLGSAVMTTAAMVLLTDLSTRANRGRVMSLFQGSLLLGVGVGPILGGLLTEAYGFRVPFVLFGVLACGSAAWAYLRIPETRDLPEGWEQEPDLEQGADVTADDDSPGSAAAGRPSGPGPGMRAMLVYLVSHRDFLLISVLTLGIFFTRSGGQMTLLPLLGHNVLDLSEGAIGGAFTLIAVVNFGALYLAGTLADRFGRKAVIVPSGLLTGLSIALFVYTDSAGRFFANAALFGAGIGLGGPAPAAYAADIAPRGAVGPAMGLYRTFSDIGLVIGPVLLGWIVDRAGYAPAFFTNAGLLVGVTLAFGLMARETAGRKTRGLRSR